MAQARGLREILLEKRDLIKEINPKFEQLYLVPIALNPPPFIKEEQKKRYQADKQRKMNVIELVSTDDQEKQSIAEQLLLYNIYKSLEARLFDRRKTELVGKLFAEVGSYSWEWMNLLTRKCLNDFASQPIDSSQSVAALKKLLEINERLPKLFWGVGHIRAAMNQLEILSHLAEKNVGNKLFADIEGFQAKVMRNIMCARKLQNNPYSETIFEMMIKDKKIKNMVIPEKPKNDATLETQQQEEKDLEGNNTLPFTMPDDNEAAFRAIEGWVGGLLKEKQYDMSMIDNPVKKEIEKINSSIASLSFFNNQPVEDKITKENSVTQIASVKQKPA